MYSRKVDGKTLDFGHEGILYRNSFIMYDKQTNSLWVHVTGEAVTGSMKGKSLEFLPATITTWAEWRKEHPKTRVLTGKRARGMMGSFSAKKQMDKYGLSIGRGRTTKLYRYTALKDEKVVNDTFDGKPIVVGFDPETATGVAFGRTVADKVLAFKPAGTGADGRPLMKDGTGRTWDLLLGLPQGAQKAGKSKSGRSRMSRPRKKKKKEAPEPEKAPEELNQLPATPWLINRWKGFYPDGPVWP